MKNTELGKYLSKYKVTAETKQFLAKSHLMYINGEDYRSTSHEEIISYNPSTLLEIARIPKATSTDVDFAVDSARHAFYQGEWSKSTPAFRATMLNKIADLLEQNQQTMAEIESLESGKAISGCLEVDVAGSIELLRYMAGWATKIEGSTREVSAPGSNFLFTRKKAIGVVGAIVPWNWPLNMAIWKLAAPLAVGCTIVIKPAQQTSLSLIYFAQLCNEAGLPAGVVNVVTGEGSTVGSCISTHPKIDKLSFTGSTNVGIGVGIAAAKNITPVTLELGGKSPMVVFEDAKVDDILNGTFNSIFFNTGQVCSAGSRMYVHESRIDEVSDALVKQAKSFVVGAELDPNTEMGPMISQAQLTSVQNYIKIGIEEGATLLTGGTSPNIENFENGVFIAPTIFGNTHNKMRIVQEEIFGPVLTIQAFSTEQEAIELANDNIYGLAASVFTQDISRALRVSDKIDAGTLWINNHDLADPCMPFGGFKQSGYGKDMGPEQLQYFLKTKAVWVSLNE